MHSAKLRAGLILLMGVACTTPAFGQESTLAEHREKVKAQAVSPEVALAHGRALRRAGREAAALAELRRGLAFTTGKNETTARLHLEIARTQIAQRQFEQAMATCKGLEKVDGTEAWMRLCNAESHLLWRRGTEASAELTKATAANAKKPATEVTYFVHVAEARVRELETKESDAETAYRAAIGVDGTRNDAHVLLGAMLRRIGKDGLPSLKKGVELDPKDPVAQLEYGRGLHAGSAEQIAAFEKAVAERPTYLEAMRALVEGYVAARRLPDAKKTVDAVLKLAPNDVYSHVVAGRVLLAEGKADEAIKEGETAHKLMPNAAPAKLLVADGWAKKGEIDLAIEAYQAAFGLDHSDYTPLVNAAHACIAAGRVTSAKAFGRRATQDFKEHAAPWVALGDALAADKDKDGARTAYESAKKAKGADGPAIDKKLAALR